MPAVAGDEVERRRAAGRAILSEFANACERDPELGADYVDAQDLWQSAASDVQRDVADETFVDVLDRFTDSRGAELTEDDVRALRALRNSRRG